MVWNQTQGCQCHTCFATANRDTANLDTASNAASHTISNHDVATMLVQLSGAMSLPARPSTFCPSKRAIASRRKAAAITASNVASSESRSQPFRICGIGSGCCGYSTPTCGFTSNCCCSVRNGQKGHRKHWHLISTFPQPIKQMMVAKFGRSQLIS